MQQEVGWILVNTKGKMRWLLPSMPGTSQLQAQGLEGRM